MFMFVFFKSLAIWYMFAKALTSLVVLTWNFLGNKYWTFELARAKLHGR
jgi:putative flippase GtrA